MKKVNRICFLVNGNQKIGLGHIYRCLTIAKKAEKRNIKVLFIVQKNLIVQELLEDKKIPFKAIDDENWLNPSKNISFFLELISSFDSIVLDLLEAEFIKFNFLKHFNVKIASITSFYYSEDVRYEDISFFPGIETRNNEFILVDNKKIKLLSGPKYLTFREEFQVNFNKTFDELIPNILITMGGTDAFGFTSFAVKSLLSLKIDYRATVIISKNCKTYKEVALLAKNNANIFIIENVNNISNIMFNSTIAIINGGLTRYELAITGTPFIALSIHQDQYDITEKITSLVGGVNIGVVKNITEEELTKSIKELILNKDKRKRISSSLQRIIDKKGTARILDDIENL